MGMQTVEEEKYLGKANEPLYSTVSADQGETLTVLSFVNAVGHVCLPLVIHKGQWVQTNWTDGMQNHFISMLVYLNCSSITYTSVNCCNKMSNQNQFYCTADEDEIAQVIITLSN